MSTQETYNTVHEQPHFRLSFYNLMIDVFYCFVSTNLGSFFQCVKISLHQEEKVKHAL